jgi:hypothetical protein
MNAQMLLSQNFNLFEKRYLSSRITCLVFIVTGILYLRGGLPLTATLITVGTITLFAAQFIFQFKWLNLFLGGMMLLLSIYLSPAVWSEFSEFEVVTEAARKLLLSGWGICFAGLTLSVLMIISFIRDFDN